MQRGERHFPLTQRQSFGDKVGFLEKHNEIPKWITKIPNSSNPPKNLVATGEIAFLYRCLLGREPRQEEIVTAGKIRKPSHLIAVLLASEEFHAKVCLATDRDVVSLYHELLKRLPESEDMVSLNVGRPLLEIAIGFARSEEYRAIVRHTDDDDIVRMFRAILGREPESEDVRASFRGRPLVEVAIELARSQEYQSGILLQATTIGRMYSALFPASKIPANWFQRFAIMLHTHAVSFPQLMSYLSELVLYQRGVQAEMGRSFVVFAHQERL